MIIRTEVKHRHGSTCTLLNVFTESPFIKHVIMGKVILSGKQRHTKVTLVITEMKDYYCWPGSLFLYTYYMFDPFKLF